MEKTFLKLENIEKRFPIPGKEDYIAVTDVNLDIKKNEIISIIGHSGCGKSTLLNMISGLDMQTDGNILLEQKEVKGPGPERAVVFQNHSLLPWLTVYQNIEMAVKKVMPELSSQELRARVEKFVSMVNLDHARDKFPGEISGGMKQRAVIALALSCDPKIVIADEPTTALDVVIQDQILKEIKKVQELLGLSLIYISHDIAVIAEMTDNMAVMYAGSIVEKGPTASIFSNPKHAYTRLLLESTPSVVGEKKKLRALDGEPPSLINGLEGCAFSPRCPEPSEDCKSKKLDMALIEVETGHWADQCCVNCG